MMKKLLLFSAALFAAVSMYAQETFEGKIVLKTMDSYSSEFIKAMPYMYSGADTCVVTVKGDDIHLQYKLSGIHKVIKNSRIYMYSDNTKTGFDMPLFEHAKDGAREATVTTNIKTIQGVQTQLIQYVSLYNAYTLEQESWVAEGNPYNFSADALKNLYAFLFTQISMDFGGKLCMKSTTRVLMSTRFDKLMDTTKRMVGDKSIVGKDKSQAENAATNEYAHSHSFEVVAIIPTRIADSELDIADNITFTTQEDLPTVEECVLAQAEIYPMMQKLFKGAMGKTVFESTVETIRQTYDYTIEEIDAGNGVKIAKNPKDLEDVRKRGLTVQESATDTFYGVKEQSLLTQNVQIMKKNKKLGKDNTQSKEVIIYDIDEEWDF